MLGSSPVIATMPAVNLDRARSFYTQVLGLRLIDLPEVSEDSGMLLEAGTGTRIFMYVAEATSARHTAATFTVGDIEKSVNELTAKGVVFEQYDMGQIKTDERGIAVAGNNKAAWFKDTEGNILGLVSMV